MALEKACWGRTDVGTIGRVEYLLHGTDGMFDIRKLCHGDFCRYYRGQPESCYDLMSHREHRGSWDGQSSEITFRDYA